MSDENLYLQATTEVVGIEKNKALWAKSMALTAGDEKLAKYKYINLRVEQLKSQENSSKLQQNNTLGKNVEKDSIFYNLRDSEIIKKLMQPFSDFKSFPHGFSRSGDFTINQSKTLETYGNVFLALHDGIDLNGISFHGIDLEELTTNPDKVKVWDKYKAIITKPKAKLFSGGGKASQRGEYFGEDIQPDYGEDREIDNGYKDDEGYT